MKVLRVFKFVLKFFKLKYLYSFRQQICLILGIIVAVLIWISTIPGLSSNATQAFAIATLIALWWIFAVMPPAIPAILGSVLFYVLNIAKPADAFAGFVSPSIWMLLFALIIAKGVESSGLGRRIANVIVLKGALSFNGLVMVFIILCIVFPFIIPSTTAIVTLNMALAVGIVEALNLDEKTRRKVSSGLTCFIAIFALTSGRGILTGSIQNIIVSGLVFSITGIQISWIEWLLNMWIIIPIPAIATYYYITKKYQPEVMLPADELRERVKQNLQEMGSITASERKVLVLVLTAVLLWAIEPYIPLDTNQIAILIGMILLLPYIGCLGIEHLKLISWDTFLFAGGSYSMGVVLTKTGFADWVASGVSSISVLQADNFVITGLFIILLAVVVHLLLETLGEVSLLTPILIKAGLLTPKAVGMLLAYGTGLYIFPYQGIPIVLSLGFNTTTWGDITKYAAFITFISILQSILFLSVYWIFTMN